MKKLFPRRFFVTGTDTDVGKTVISAILMAGFKGAYWKPVQSGLEDTTDTEWIRRATGLPEPHFFPETYRLLRALSPHASAAAEGVRIDLAAFSVPRTEGYLIVEGAGGIMAPLNEKEYMGDLMQLLNLPVILVARSTLGTINHTLLSLAALRARGLDVIGVVMNGPENGSNRDAIVHYGKTDVLAEVPPLPSMDASALKEAFERYFCVKG